MNKTEEKLKERIKELTCLYEVASIIENTDFEQIESIFTQIARSLKKAFQHPEKVEVYIDCPPFKTQMFKSNTNAASLKSAIKVFKETKGTIIAFYSSLNESSFLKEEQDLLDNIGMKIGGLLERIEINKSEISLKRQMERADRLVILGELTAGIAHELNTPLANILGYSELLKSELKSNETVKADLEKIIENTIFSREVVKKLMFFACEMPQEMKEINLVPIIKNAINLLDSSFRKNEVKYLVKIDKEEINLRADSIQLTQIIFNLCMNAIYFSPKGGLVTISAVENKASIVLEISDEGKGLSEEALEKVFQPFYTTKPVGEGSGLGLSVVHGIVNSHKGSIIVKNNVTKGAMFQVTLPK